MKRSWVILGLVNIGVLFGGAAVPAGWNPRVLAAIAAPAEDALERCFRERYPGKAPVVTAREDVNADGRGDLVVLYRDTPERNRMTVVFSPESRCATTNDLPAPYENQKVWFRDIDEKPPREFVVQGSRGMHIGYAIFRVVGERLVNLFGDGMEECC